MKAQMTFGPQVEARGLVDVATLELLAAWRREDATDDPELIRVAELELAEFKKSMNENRAGSGEHFPF